MTAPSMTAKEDPDPRRPEPGFAELLRGNLLVLGYVALGVAAAWLLWRGLVWLFPDVAWLQPRA